jgi:selenide,water dikinase
LEAILPQIAALNRAAMEGASKSDVHACTDVTGYGILGHTLEIAKASDVQIELFYNELPFYENALDMYRKGENTGSNKANRKLVNGFWEALSKMSDPEEALLFDPQTSGGLLLVVAESQAEGVIAELKGTGLGTVARIGKVVAHDRPYLRVI